ncbi:MAG: hypothetical protein UHD09_08215, partial [Bifidobacterium sp.]|nr:hypothetical protein [Bifidobacterium sp.]
DEVLDAVADAATAAEGTVSEQGCAANATITQLNLVANTLDSATASLKQSIAKIKEDPQGALSGLTSDDDTSSEPNSDASPSPSVSASPSASPSESASPSASPP